MSGSGSDPEWIDEAATDPAPDGEAGAADAVEGAGDAAGRAKAAVSARDRDRVTGDLRDRLSRIGSAMSEPTADVDLGAIRETFGASRPLARALRVAASLVPDGEAILDPETADGRDRPSRGADLLAALVDVLRARADAVDDADDVEETSAGAAPDAEPERAADAGAEWGDL